MKHFLFVRSIVATAFLFAVSGCKQDDFLGDNVSPNSPLTVTPAVLLSNIEVHTAFTFSNEIGRVTDLLTQHYAGIANQPATYDIYALLGNFDNEWQFDLYAGTLEDAQTLITLTQTDNPAYAGIAKLIKAYNFALVTDLWGDVPYSQALQGRELLQPRFDKQEDIYKGNEQLQIQSLFALVREGLADLDKPNLLLPGADDLIYGGGQAGVNKWKRFGNTLLLKLANTISKREPALATQVIREVITGNNFIASNTDDFELRFGTTVGNTNPFYAYNVTNRPNDQMASRRFLDSLALRKDPRLPRYFTTTPTNTASITVGAPYVVPGTPLPPQPAGLGIYTGYQNGDIVAAPAAANRSRYNTYIVGTSGEAPVRMVTNFQRLFILAESALILKTAGDPQTLFQQAIRASMTKAGVADADITGYFADPANARWVTLRGNDEQKRNQIITQKWIALLGNGYEAYNDYRRTGYPQLALSLNPSTQSPNAIPIRFPYPTSETVANANNIPTPLPALNAHVWWDTE